MRTTRTLRGGVKISGRSLYSLTTNDVIEIRRLSTTLFIQKELVFQGAFKRIAIVEQNAKVSFNMDQII